MSLRFVNFLFDTVDERCNCNEYAPPREKKPHGTVNDAFPSCIIHVSICISPTNSDVNPSSRKTLFYIDKTIKNIC